MAKAKTIEPKKAQGEFHGTHTVLRPYLSEKSQGLLKNNQYVFLVSPDATKNTVKSEIMQKYHVHVTHVTVTTIRSKPKHYRGKVTVFRNRKKATVRIKDGEKIDIA